MDKWSQWTWITLLRQSILREGIHTFLKCEWIYRRSSGFPSTVQLSRSFIPNGHTIIVHRIRGILRVKILPMVHELNLAHYLLS
jgi:hypothetical protein